MNETKSSRSSFSGKMGFVLSAAGASVGLGNIWRFPYLAASYGGGIFLLVYLVLALTFGYTMIMSETTIGRMTGKSPVGAFDKLGTTKAKKAGGWINAIIPVLIVPYYSVIGGWVFKYLIEYIRGNVSQAADDSYFSGFLASPLQQELWFILFAVLTLFIIYLGVENGIERVSKSLMPVLVVLALIIAVYSMTRKGAVEGIKYFLIPDLSKFSWMTVVAALGQMFYSLSIAMGILITFGSYMTKDMDIEHATVQVEIFDTIIAVMSGLMIIPAVFAFSANPTSDLKSGPSLMFVTMPHIFESMGIGRIIGILFFALVLFAALTSSIALMESAVSTIQDELGWNRKKGTLLMAVIMLSLGTLSCLGFNVLSNVTPLGMDFLSFFDFLTNSVMMPLAAIAICILILKSVGTDRIAEEVESSSKFKRRGVYQFVLKYFAIFFLLIILGSSIASVLGIISI